LEILDYGLSGGAADVGVVALAKARRRWLDQIPPKRFADSANQDYPSQNVAFVYFESDRGMTAPDELLRTIDGLKELLRIAWSKLADPLLTPIDRREARSQIRQHSAELRRYLQAIEARRARDQSIEPHPGTAPKKPLLRFWHSSKRYVASFQLFRLHSNRELERYSAPAALSHDGADT
jgi:hypothetical protein